MSNQTPSTCCAPGCCAAPGTPEPGQQIRDAVKERYAEAARTVTRGAKPSCCGSSPPRARPIRSPAISTPRTRLPGSRAGPLGFFRLWQSHGPGRAPAG